MKPGSVSVRPFQACFPQTSSDQVDPVVKTRRLVLLDPVTAGGYPFGQLLTAPPDKPVFSKIDSFEPYLEEMEQLKLSPSRSFLVPVYLGLIIQR